jgi:hypothetical protein
VGGYDVGQASDQGADLRDGYLWHTTVYESRAPGRGLRGLTFELSCPRRQAL